MNAAFLGHLAVLTLANPAEAARRLLTSVPGRDVLWTALALVVVLNALSQSLSTLVFPALDPSLDMAFEPVVQSLATSAGAVLLGIFAFHFVGRMLGGTGSLDGMMLLMVWLQFLQILGQLIIFVMVMVAPTMFLILVLGMSLYSLYISLHFINQAHHFDSLGKSFVVILISGLLAIPFVLLMTPSGPV
ncbi:Yip1 family protein [Ruegeria arenilitoris]|uniref:Yip1 family protein n=1 Tax=Ruegeria arenilitoris TaxID=1173585 RepID=UPI001C95A831|nr:Yip1 family protein [Ruegeria arenilitoris]MBY6081199.1 YIP1 family protein [Ruegeria arenilitoris]